MTDLRRGDRDRYLTTLFAPGDARAGLVAVYGVNLELARIADTVSEDLIGRMRLQWWRDRLEDLYSDAPGAGPPKGHPVLAALDRAIRRHDLKRDRLAHMIDGREAEMTGGPPADVDDLIARADQGPAAVMALAGDILTGGLDAPGLAAVTCAARVQALTGAVMSVPFMLRRGRVPLPDAVCRREGFDTEKFYDRGPEGQEDALRRAVASVAGRARDELKPLRGMTPPRRLLPALLPARLAARDLARLARAGHDPFDHRVLRIDGMRPAILLGAALRGKV
ncbi:MAG: squalene/phytoene synthase family protein [Rhodospirillaceae bacterium]